MYRSQVPPCAKWIEFTTGTFDVVLVESFRTSDGLRVSYYQVESGESGLGAPVFLLHGFASDSQVSWVDPGMVRTLAASGREVFALDARGHGISDTPHDSRFYGETRMSRDVVERLDSLDVERVDLVGHSMGAVVALITASSDQRIRRLVLSGVGRYQLDYDGGPLPHFDTEGLRKLSQLTIQTRSAIRS